MTAVVLALEHVATFSPSWLVNLLLSMIPAFGYALDCLSVHECDTDLGLVGLKIGTLCACSRLLPTTLLYVVCSTAILIPVT
ncbi:uncharacterized protein MYCFIDRAFT_202048 [Pseudocercospora fijiensis CIRAD86]|uniref:Uncharacterized protein n=1 Tax=Pseudocercospora fijiensis (strain CIRAD86) TaxID=383855 RepID=N1Q9Z7_PSEFD|nr:uncharacterized protein MYCFIDRAFT_202048 [Pseudocercospora fijiensis CIRAD86]EME89750.1 hypothetical protein MYCFIDRAFT_202048 [Pseudocercospora fijiensis CIRAD86]